MNAALRRLRPAEENAMTNTVARRFTSAALIVAAGLLGFATTAQAKPVKQIDAALIDGLFKLPMV